MIQNLKLFFLKIFIRIFNFYMSFFLISDFFAGSLKASTNYRKRLLIWQYDFGQDTSLIFWTSAQLTLKITCPCSTAKTFLNLLKSFQQTCFRSEKTLALHRFLTPKTAFLKYFARKDVVKFYLMRRGLGWGGVWGLNNSIKAACFFGLVKCFTNFHFNLKFL